MKKIIFIALFVILVAVLPFVGNSVVKNALDTRLKTLMNYGLDFELVQQEKGYLHTQLEYTITVSDKQKFVQYLQQFSSHQLPPYTQSLVDGVVFGLKLRYNNIPLSEKISIELYPLKLSKATMQEIEQNNTELYKLVLKVLKNKAIVYRIRYAVVTGEFQGSMKDFDEVLKLEDNQTLQVQFSGVEASGSGMILAPDNLQTRIQQFHILLSGVDGNVEILLKGLYSTSSFESESTYITSMKLDDLSLRFYNPTTQDAATITAKKVSFDTSSNTQGVDAKVYLKTVCDEVMVENKKQNQIYGVEGFGLDLAITKLHKPSYLELLHFFQNYTRGSTLTQEQQEHIASLLRSILLHGIDIQVANFYTKQLIVAKDKKLDGFRMQHHLVLLPSPMATQQDTLLLDRLMQHTTIDSHVEFSESFYGFINQLYPIDLLFGVYKKEKDSHVIFDINYKNDQLTINQQVVR